MISSIWHVMWTQHLGQKLSKENLLIWQICCQKNEVLGGSGQAMSDGSIVELITKGGHTYFAPAKENDAKINNVRKWDAAFRVYAAIYSEANPSTQNLAVRIHDPQGGIQFCVG